MSILGRSLILMGVIACLAACARFQAFQANPGAQLPYHHNSSDFNVSWNRSQSGNETVMEGFIKNLRNMQLKDFDLNVAVLDTDGRRLTEETVLLDKINLRINESIPFSVKLKNAKIAKENVLRFIISYSIDDGSYYGRGSQSSFKVDAETGAAIEEQTEKQD